MDLFNIQDFQNQTEQLKLEIHSVKSDLLSSARVAFEEAKIKWSMKQSQFEDMITELVVS